MEDRRITVKELKTWLEDKDDKAEIFVEKYSNVHAKEFLVVRDWDEKGKLAESELLVSSYKVDPVFSNCGDN